MSTIKDVAKLAGVSVATVSRIINDSPNVSPATRKKVERVIKEINYQPNQVARTLYQKKSRMIGIIIPDLNNRFYAQIIDGIQSILQKKGYSALISFSANSNKKNYLNFINEFQKNNIDGIITAAFDMPATLNLATPLVMYDSANIDDNVARIVSDNIKGGKDCISLLQNQATRVMIQHWPLKLPTVRERVESLVNELNKLNIPYILKKVSETDPEKAAQEVLKKSNRFDAVIAVNDIYAAEIIKEAQRRNLKIPADFQLIGYDNNVLCEYTTPTISTIDQQPKLIGQTAARRLLDLINGKKSSQNSIINVIPIKRNSTY